MKKLVCIVLCLICLLGLMPTALAAGGEVVFTGDSSFEAGGTVKVDKQKTVKSVHSFGNSAQYNAILAGRVQYYWMRNDSYYADGMTLNLAEKDKGCTFYCVAALFSDEDRTQPVGTITSTKFSVPNTGNPAVKPTITTSSLIEGKVNEAYYQKIECSDPDVVFTISGGQLPDGLYLTQHGEIEGTPTKIGYWQLQVKATPEAGAEYAATAEFVITINGKIPQYTITLRALPDKTIYTVGENLDLTGLVVRIRSSSGYRDTYDGAEMSYSPKKLTKVGKQTVILTYEDAEIDFYVVANEAPTTTTTKAAVKTTTAAPKTTTTAPKATTTAPKATTAATKATAVATRTTTTAAMTTAAMTESVTETEVTETSETTVTTSAAENTTEETKAASQKDFKHKKGSGKKTEATDNTEVTETTPQSEKSKDKANRLPKGQTAQTSSTAAQEKHENVFAQNPIFLVIAIVVGIFVVASVVIIFVVVKRKI